MALSDYTSNPEGGGNFGGTQTANVGEPGYDPSAGANYYGLPYETDPSAGYTTGQSADPASPAFSPPTGGSFWDNMWESMKRYGKGRAFGAVAQRVGDAAPLVGPAMAAANAPQGQRAPAAFNSMMGQTVNGALMGINPVLGSINYGVGALTGKTLGSLFQSDGSNPNGFTQNTAASGGNPSRSGSYSNIDNLLTGLAGMYTANKANGSINNQINSLTGMYGQDSPYAQALRSGLERKDAAAGRRSQAGSREVQLQAKLAEMASRNSGAVATLEGQRNKNREKRLNDLLYFGRSSGLFDKAGQGISDWMASNNNVNYGNEGLNYQTQPFDYNQLLDQQG